MKCAKCGLELLPGTKQCPKCGCVNEFEPAPAEKKKRSPIVYAIIGLAVVGIIALIFLLMANGKNVASAPGGVDRVDSNITTAPPGKQGPSGIVTAPPGKPATATTPPGVTKPKPPQEVVDYLAYVKKVEEHRQMLLDDNTEALRIVLQGTTGMFLGAVENDEDPWAAPKRECNRQAGNWQATLRYFDNKPAPPECRDFSGAYRTVLQTQTASTTQIAVALDRMDFSDTKNTKQKGQMYDALNKMLGTVQAPINKSIEDADSKLNSLVAEYDMKKPFEIRREQQNGNILGF